jgi:ketosteroid isomerase-like protein
MATFTDDSVLMPAQGSTPAVGREAIRKYWRPASGPKTTIKKLNITYEEIGGERGTAYARGRGEVGWTIEENGTRKSHANSGMNLNEKASGWFLAHFASHGGRRSEQEPIGTTGIGRLLQ